MEQDYMWENSCKGSKSHSINHCKKCAHIDWAILLIGIEVKVEIRVYDAWYIIDLSFGIKEVVREYGECLGMVGVEPVSYRGYDIHDDDEARSNISGGKPGACKGAA